MIVFKLIKPLQDHLAKLKKQGLKLGFVPTMGALHKGHISIMQQSTKANDITVCSIFVNPTQFNDKSDFEKYPVTIESDIKQLVSAGCNILFLPSADEVYPQDFDKKQHFDLGYLETILEGAYRAGHFQGVAMVVKRLLEIVQPHELFLGRKDLQQYKVLQHMVKEYRVPVKITVADTLREENGLAMSSRNQRLSDAEKEKATVIYKAMQFVKANLLKLNIDELKQRASQMILDAGFEKIDYVDIIDSETLLPVTVFSSNQKITAIIAAFIGGVRLIDNMEVN